MLIHEFPLVCLDVKEEMNYNFPKQKNNKLAEVNLVDKFALKYKGSYYDTNIILI